MENIRSYEGIFLHFYNFYCNLLFILNYSPNYTEKRKLCYLFYAIKYVKKYSKLDNMKSIFPMAAAK